MSVLSRRKGNQLLIHRFCIVILYALSTTSVAINTYSEDLDVDYSRRLGKPDLLELYVSQRSRIMYALQALTVTSNLITDAILLWRCFLVWGRRIRVVIFPIFFSITVNISNLGAIDFYTIRSDNKDLTPSPNSVMLLCFTIGSVCNNLLLTAMIAGRIFYISREVASLRKRPIAGMYKTLIHASVESGLLYPVVLAGYTTSLILSYELVLHDGLASPFIRANIACEILYSCFIPIMGIASTLIIVRSALGIAINGEKSFKLTVLGGRDGNEGSRGIVHSIIQIRGRGESTVDREEMGLGDVAGNEKQEETNGRMGQNSV
ncbi:hypothetical protein PM082_014823 [Marasmius tenuissimus]|nr:hypothetical protein PM082_014823 [Marasmius tenuissimus]